MAGSLPVKVSYRLPVGWVSVPPDEAGARSAAFVALHRRTVENEFAANITIEGGLWPNPAPLPELADDSVRVLRENPILSQVEILERREIAEPTTPEVGSPAVSGLRQVLRARQYKDHTERWLIQVQTYLPVPYPRDPGMQAVLTISMTATPTQLEKVSGDFEYFLYGILQRTLGVKYFGGLGEVDGSRVTATANAAADAVRDIAATAAEWATADWDTLAEGGGNT